MTFISALTLASLFFLGKAIIIITEKSSWFINYLDILLDIHSRICKDGMSALCKRKSWTRQQFQFQSPKILRNSHSYRHMFIHTSWVVLILVTRAIYVKRRVEEKGNMNVLLHVRPAEKLPFRIRAIYLHAKRIENLPLRYFMSCMKSFRLYWPNKNFTALVINR